MIEASKSRLGAWRRINMRNVEHLIGVEFIHDLYNRYEPKINSIRFRHTKTVWKNGIVTSFAPECEWERLGSILCYRYASLDPILLKYTKQLYERKREHFHEFIKYLSKINLIKVADKDLAILLVNFQSIVLGELYVLNFVQVECGLNAAVKSVLINALKDKGKAEEAFIELIKTDIPTESQKERRRLYLLAKKWRIIKCLGLYSEAAAQKDVHRHTEKFRYLYSAYGESPKCFDDFWALFQFFLNGSLPPPPFSFSFRLFSPGSKMMLRKINSRHLSVLLPLLIKGGIFRDTNKALLGQSMRYRFDILDEIANRKLETRSNLNFYLLSEIVDLLSSHTKLTPEVIHGRKSQGIEFVRSEDFSLCNDQEPDDVSETQNVLLRGQGASKGKCRGVCKIVLTKNDAYKVNKGEIMVAIGTDFDLIEAMYRSSAVITEEGGILSHASVVCRELGKPCCIGVKDATKILKDGQMIELDAVEGKVSLI